jgi:hypothetical protein
MPETPGVVLTNVLPIEGETPAENTQERRLAALARLAFRVGLQDEAVMQPGTMTQLFKEDFVSPVRAWCRSNKVRLCYISVYEDAPAVFVVGSTDGYDHTLSGPLADLEMDLHRRGFSCSVLQLPASSPSLLPAFIDGSRAIQVCP